LNRETRNWHIEPHGVSHLRLQESPALKPLVSEWLSQIPKGRLASVADLQTAIVYLASDASNYMVGHNLVIEGGQSLW
jgi:NAD(P)-dependent dehydrogenase (short-subunit alcohol dehydrogenase family)